MHLVGDYLKALVQALEEVKLIKINTDNKKL